MALPADEDLADLTLRALHHLGGKARTVDIDESVFHSVSPPLRPREFEALSRRLRAVRNDLVDRKWLAHPARGDWELTVRGAEQAAKTATAPPISDRVREEASDEVRAEEDSGPTPSVNGAGSEQDGRQTETTSRLLVQGSTIAEPLLNRDERKQMGLPTSEDEPMTMLIELNLRHGDGLQSAKDQFFEIFDRVSGTDPKRVVTIADIYLRCKLSLHQAQELVREDIKLVNDPSARSRKRSIYRIWPDFPVEPI